MKLLSHDKKTGHINPFVVMYLGSCEDDSVEESYILMDKAQNTLESVLTLCADNNEKVPEQDLLTVLFQSALALCWMAKQFDVAHNDAHMNNIMFVIPKEGDALYKKYIKTSLAGKKFTIPTQVVAKLIDFGWATQYMPDAKVKFSERTALR